MTLKAISISKRGRIITKAATDPKKELSDDMIKAEPLAKRQKTSGADASTLRAVELAARCGSLSSLPVRPLSFALSLLLDSFVKPLRRPRQRAGFDAQGCGEGRRSSMLAVLPRPLRVVLAVVQPTPAPAPAPAPASGASTPCAHPVAWQMHGQIEPAFNLGNQGNALQDGEVVDSSEWFKANCEKEQHTVYWHKFKEGTLKTVSSGTRVDASTLGVEDKASRWAKHAISFYEDVFGGLGLPGGIQIAEVEAGGGEMLATIVHAKLHQSGKPWASWTWLGNVPAKATAQLQHIKEAIGKFGEQLLEQNVIEALVAARTTQR